VGIPCRGLKRRIGLPRVPEGNGEAGYGVRRVFRDVRPRGRRLPRATGRRRSGVRGGERLVRSTSWLVGLRHRPPRPCAPRTCGGWPSRVRRSGRRAPVKVSERAPRDLGAACPDGCPVRAARHRCRASSPGVVQRTPLHRTVGESTPGFGIAASTVGTRRPAVSSFRPRGFSPPRRLAPPRPCGPVASRCRSWGSPRFHRVRRPGFPAMRSCPPKPCSPPAATPPRPSRGFPRVRRGDVGPRHRPGRSQLVRSPRTLALLTFFPPAATTVARRACPGSRASRALLRRRVRYPPPRFRGREPDAPMGLADGPRCPASRRSRCGRSRVPTPACAGPGARGGA
jgi:hypothetical protein